MHWNETSWRVWRACDGALEGGVERDAGKRQVQFEDLALEVWEQGQAS